MQITILGSGDAFGTGGRRQTSFLLTTSDRKILVDCGATTLMALQQNRISPNEISTVVLSHLHGDHFSGLVWFLMHARHVSKRTQPLTIVGPEETEQQLLAAGDILFPGFSAKPFSFEIQYAAHENNTAKEVDGLTITPVPVVHPCGSIPFALRIETEGKVFAFSGDTAWTDSLMSVEHEADLFICECYGFDGNTPGHISWTTLREKLPTLSAKKILLTHMGPDMLAKRDEIQIDRVGFCHDDSVIEI